MEQLITNESIGNFTFAEYEKIGTTKLSNEVLAVGQRVKTLEGEYTCAEPSRLAIDASGNVYPVAVSIFERSYREPGKELRNWQRFAAYCHSCAMSGECDPQDFFEFCRMESEMR